MTNMNSIPTGAIRELENVNEGDFVFFFESIFHHFCRHLNQTTQRGGEVATNKATFLHDTAPENLHQSRFDKIFTGTLAITSERGIKYTFSFR